MQPTPISLYFKGSRNYVHGTTIFQYMWEYLAANLPGFNETQHHIKIKFFKLIRELHNQAFLQIMDDQSGEHDPVATMDFEYMGSSLRLALLEDRSSLVSESLPGREGILLPNNPILTGDFEGNAILKGVDSIYALIEGMIETNKRLHLLTMGCGDHVPKVRWVYLQKFTIDPSWRLEGQDLEVEITHKGSRHMEDRTYTLNNVKIKNLHTPLETILCFSYF
jgi:hypothetical protein